MCDTSKPYHSHDTCFPIDMTLQRPWALSEIYGRPIRGSCSISENNTSPAVSLHVLPNQEVSVTGSDSEHRSLDGSLRLYSLGSGTDFDIALPQRPAPATLTPEVPLLFAERSIVGQGQERGGIQTILKNPSAVDAISFVYLETLPWFMKPYIHTLKARVLPPQPAGSDAIIQDIYYRPALDRHRGTQLELRLVIPVGSTVTLTYDFDKAILRYTEYPPDANRGFDVAPAVIRILPADDTGESTYVRTTSLLLPLPTPDFSMPYNVIILTSTVMALAFGSIFNLLVRRFIGADEVPESTLAIMREKVKGKLSLFKEKINGRFKNSDREGYHPKRAIQN